jgi:2-polyprenyl-3-methyl-5-hydroxy-6-metoxy-1,4-benzoquinol methylase
LDDVEAERAAMARLRAYWDRLGLAGPERAYAEYQARRYPHLLRFWSARPRLDGQRILDLGGGIGGVAVCLSAARGGEYDLAEYIPLSDDRRPIAREFGIRNALRCDLTAVAPFEPLPDRSDVILFVEVLEHLLVNPRYLFRQMATRLRRPGRVFVTTPNLVRLSSRLRLLRGRSIRDPNSFSEGPHGPFGHVAEYSLADLVELLGLEGYRLEAATVVQNPATPEGLEVRSESRGTFRRLAYRLLDTPPARRWQLGDELQALFRID